MSASATSAAGKKPGSDASRTNSGRRFWIDKASALAARDSALHADALTCDSENFPSRACRESHRSRKHRTFGDFFARDRRNAHWHTRVIHTLKRSLNTTLEGRRVARSY